MCKDFRYDDNKVKFGGTAVPGTLILYKIKKQLRCEFKIHSQMEHRITKMVVQFRGQNAHDAFMLYQGNREFDVVGHIKYRKGGRYCVVVDDFGVGDMPKNSHVDISTLLDEKIDAMDQGQPRRQPAEDVVENDPVPYNEILDEAMMENRDIAVDGETGPMVEPGMVFVSEANDKIGVPVEVDINGNPMEPIAPEDQEGLMVDREEADGDVS